MLTNTTASPTLSYTLTCTDGKAIGATEGEATPFYMVVPAGAYKFEVGVYDNAATPAKICSFATSEAKTFTAGECLNMPAKEVAEPFVPTYVDLGLPSGVKWATCNVGATKPEEYGDYFAWGETSPKTTYSAGTYTYTDNPTTLPAEHDAAAVNWGGAWRMPTKAEQDELRNTENCKWIWQEDYNSTGVNGYLVTSERNDNSIFLPAASYRGSSSVISPYGHYWSSSLYESYSDYAYNLYFYSGYVEWDGNDRYYGYSVRPVCQ